MCEICINIYHRQCTGITFYKRVNKSFGRKASWTCHKCTLSILPFHNQRDLDLDSSLESEISDNNDILKTLQDKATQLKVMHLNTQSMVSTFNEFALTVNTYPLDIIALSETWLKDHKLLMEYVNLPGFVTEFRNRVDTRGGGVGIYIKDTIKYKRRYDIETAHQNLEHLWLEVPGKNRHSKLLFGVIYRSQALMTPSMWLNDLEDLLSHINTIWDGMIVLTGDINIDCFKPNDSVTKQYLALLDIFNLKQMITKATRVTQHSKTLIDHIITNYSSRVTYTDVIPCSIVSDHDAPVACINVRVQRFQARYKYIRNLKHFVEQNFIDDCSALPFSLIYSTTDPDEQLHYFNELFTECLQRHAPLRRIRVTRPPSPWMKSDEIFHLQHERDKLRKQAHSSNSDKDWDLFRAVRNKLKTAIRHSRRVFISKALSSKRPKEVWQVIHRILNPSQHPIQQDPDKLNTFFASTAERTIGPQVNCHISIEQIIANLKATEETEIKCFSLSVVTRDEVLNVLKSLRSDSSTGHDQIPIKFVKLVADTISGPLTAIINNCITQSYFPVSWKKAKISPIPKTDHPTTDEHFRPISVLPALSKVFEKLVANQMIGFCERESSLRDTISGFRRGLEGTPLVQY